MYLACSFAPPLCVGEATLVLGRGTPAVRPEPIPEYGRAFPAPEELFGEDDGWRALIEVLRPQPFQQVHVLVEHGED